jgi:hypothetical protein
MATVIRIPKRKRRHAQTTTIGDWLAMSALTLLSIPAAVFVGLAMAESARLIG